MKTHSSDLLLVFPMFRGIKGRVRARGTARFCVLRRAKIYLRDSLAFINGNGDGGGGARALREAV